MAEHNELTPEELKGIFGGKLARQAEKPTPEDKKTRPTREGKLTVRRQDTPDL